jgi:hypothetical protein
MRLTHTNKLQAYACALEVAALVLMFVTSSQAQRKSDAPALWYHPEGVVERGDVAELKDVHRVYVSISPGQASNVYVVRLQQQMLKQLKEYPGLSIVKDPNAAELAIYIRIRPSSSPAFDSGRSRPLYSSQETNVSITNEVDFFVVTRGAKRGEGNYMSRVLIQKHHTETEYVTPATSLDVDSMIKKMKTLRGEK